MKKNLTRFAMLLTLLIVASACTTKNAPPKAWLSKNIEVNLPAPSRDTELHVQQLLSTTYQDKTHSLIVLLDAKDDNVQLVGLTPIGIRLFTASYDKNGIHSKQAMPIPNLPKANQVLADIMLAYWPITTWQNLLPKDWKLTDVNDMRYLKNENNEPILEIQYQEKNNVRTPIKVTHYVFGYSIQLDDMNDNDDENHDGTQGDFE